MRSFVISEIIILICFGISTVNCIWTRNRINTLISEVYTVTKNDVDKFQSKWNSAKKVLEFTTRRTYIRDIEDAMQRLNVALENDDRFELGTARKALIYNMEELCNSQSFDPKSVL